MIFNSFQAKLCLLLLVTLTNGWHYHRNSFEEPGATYTNQKVQFFDQIVDHFSYLPPAFWKQRYYVTNTYFDALSGPVIIYICGQGPCHGVSDQSWTTEIAKQTKGLIVALQHRYYGQSMPFRSDPLSLSNLKYLSSKQALKDIAFFIEEVKKNKWHDVTAENKWITIGGSYPGALSAWFRAKYPHLTVGAIASSAVILAVQDFKQFDQQVFLSVNKSGQFCVNAIRSLVDYAEQQSLSENKDYFQGLFKAQKLTTRQFMGFWVDVLASAVQYGTRTSLCNLLKNKTLEQMIEAVKPAMKNNNPYDYAWVYLNNSTLMMEQGSGARSWAYQCCTEFSYFQTYSDKHPMRSKMLTIDFYRKWCEDIFGQGTWPSVKRTNVEYGGLKINADHLIMVNGIEDPWQWASLTKNYRNVVTKVANCTNCAHCCDLYAPAKTDAKELTAIRDYELTTIKSWLK